ncbi:MAG: hypothetical protein H7222_15980 [Methylotenera sp.]|nr:hypothetical protein [Oligoflexia bacterium]
MFKLDREKYYQILKSEGLSAAITTLHRDSTGFEFDTFEGRDGYSREMWDGLFDVREFSRELWNVALEQNLVDPADKRLKSP